MPEILPVVPTGPRNRPKIAIVGEYPGDEEMKVGVPFVGKQGGLLTSLLSRAGIKRKDCYFTYVFLRQPPFNNAEYWCDTKNEVNDIWKREGRPGKYPHSFMTKTRAKKSPVYLRPEHFGELARLQEELLAIKPNLVIALGNIPCWALLGSSSVNSVRGTLCKGPFLGDIKILPTHAPGAILRQWELFPIALADLEKAARVCETPELVYPKRQIWLEPTLSDLEIFWNDYIIQSRGLGVDVETKAGQITCIGFATSPNECLVIPFWDTNSPDVHYWKTKEEEVQALSFVKRVLQTPIPKIFQNGLYDIQYIWKTWGIPILGPIEDTMILHHALQPELSKGLGFLGSLYTDEPSWKFMRRHKNDTEKRDE